MSEHWLPIPGYEGLYEVSDQGRVKSLPRHYKNYRRRQALILSPAPTPTGYACVSLHERGNSHVEQVHGLVLLAFIGPRPPGIHTNHKNGNRTDNRLGNLEYVTPKENFRHAVEVLNTVHWIHGEQVNTCKLTPAKVLRIRELYATGQYSQQQLAHRYGVGRTQISNIVLRYSWKWLP